MTTTFLEIPTQPSPESLRFLIGNVPYRATIKWNDDPSAQCWVLDLYDDQQNLLAGGIMLVTGADLLGQLTYLGVGAQLFTQTDFDADAPPTFENLGSLGHLFVAIAS